MMPDVDMQHCPNRGGSVLRIIAAIFERPLTDKMLTDVGAFGIPLAAVVVADAKRPAGR